MAVRDRKLAFLLGGLALAACGDSTAPEEEENDDPCAASQPITLGQSVSGSLSSTDCRLTASSTYADRWSLTLAQATTVRIDLASAQFDAVLELRTGAGTVVATNDDAGPTFNSRIVENLAAGSYVIVATTFAEGMVGGYQLSVIVGADCSAIGTLELDQTVTGTLAVDDCVWEYGGLQDSWSFSLTSRERVRFDLVSSAFMEIVLIRDAEGDILDGGVNQGVLGFARADVTLPAGEYTISAASETETDVGSYELTAYVPPPCDPGTTFAIGDTIQSSLSESDCILDGISPADSFGLALSETTPLRVHVKSSDFDPVVFLRNEAGLDVAAGLDFDQDGSVRFQDTFSAGTYALWVSSLDAQSFGDYQISVDEIVCNEPTPIALGTTEESTLDADDCLRSNGAFQELWALELANDTTVRIDLSSQSFDAYLVLMDSTGVSLAVDDDGGPNLDARIERELGAGRYLIAASTFSQDVTGTYALTVAVPPPPAAAASTTVTPSPPVVGSKLRPAPAPGLVPRTSLFAQWLEGRLAKLPAQDRRD